jgi:D-alanyl-D-alanine carboxypeptidase (penicillin-binding protein 5/6)
MRTPKGQQRLRFSKVAAALVALMLALVLGASGEDRAVGQEKSTARQQAPGLSVPKPPTVEGQAWVLTDADSGLYLAGDNPDEQLPPAATIQIMTALVALEEGADVDEEVTVPEEAEAYVGSTYSNVGLIAGERLTVRDLLTAALDPSGIDAIYTLANHLGDGSVDEFAQKMNAEASTMGLRNTHFDDPTGLDSPGNYSSARDLATMTRAALGYSTFAEIVRTKDATIDTQNRKIEVSNTNQILTTYPKATGVKTGFSPQAGANIVASAEDGDESYIAVILGADDSDRRFRDAEALLEYAFTYYERRPLVVKDEVYGEVAPPYRPGQSVELVAVDDVTGTVNAGSDVEREVTTEEELPPSASAGQELGEVEVFVDGQSVGRSPLVVQEGYEAASLWDKAWYYAVEWVGGSIWRLVRG